MDDETVALILAISIAVLVVIGLIFWHFYRRWRKRNSQGLQETRHRDVRRVYQDIFSSASSQEIRGTHRSHVPEARIVYQDIFTVSGSEHRRELPTATRQQR